MKLSKILMISGALLLLPLFVLPMWNITLEAPQYPTPLGISIHINKMTGYTPTDVQNIDILNHYVGMAELPVKLKEFELFPPIIIGMVILGLIFGLIGKKRLFLIWFIIAAILGSIGMYDFYQWEYEYGHNLNPKAALKMPGQAYQPPLVGSKKILTITASSYPASGGYIMFCGIFLSLAAYYVATKKEES